jgi:hypothetical protein
VAGDGRDGAHAGRAYHIVGTGNLFLDDQNQDL